MLHNLRVRPLVRAYVLLARAAYYIETNNLSAAKDDLETVWKLEEPWAEQFFFAGHQGSLAAYWAATARLCSKRGDGAGAVSAWREAVTRQRIIAQLPQLEGPYKYNSLAAALRNLGRALRETNSSLAEDSFNESRSIRRASGLPPLPE